MSVSSINADIAAAYQNTINDLNSGASTDQLRQDEYAFLVASRGGQEPGTTNTLKAMQNMDNSFPEGGDGSFDPNNSRQALTDAAIADGITAVPPNTPSQPDQTQQPSQSWPYKVINKEAQSREPF